MEMKDLRYFIQVARTQNMHRASESTNISVSSLSKSIKKLEEELGVNLFQRVGRNIELTDHGHFLKKRAAKLIELEDLTKEEILGTEYDIEINIGGSEILLSTFGIDISKKIKSRLKKSRINFVVESESLFTRLKDRDLDLGLTTYDVPEEVDSKTLAIITFGIYCSKNHSLYKKAKNKIIGIEDLLKYSFVTPKQRILGKINSSDSLDGWRDDKFPRKISFISPSLKVMESIISSGEALAYLPDYLGSNLGFTKVEVKGCSYVCKQKIRLVAKNKKHSGWMSQLFL